MASEIRITSMVLGSVRLPANHPRAVDGDCVIQGYVIHHPDGPIVVDTGVADDHELINDLYQPHVVPIVEALNEAGVDERDIVAIVNTHLHFDHCGQNRMLPSVPVYAQAAELAAAQVPLFTVPEWADIAVGRRRVLDGDAEIASGVSAIATVGHTPGHQSVVVTSGDRVEIIAGQCCYTCSEFVAGEVLPTDMHDASFFEQGAESLARLRAFDPAAAFFSHDVTVYRR